MNSPRWQLRSPVAVALLCSAAIGAQYVSGKVVRDTLFLDVFDGKTALPWMTGNPYALYAHVRAHVGSRVTRWSTPFGLNMRWKAEPEQILPDTPGLVRWTPVEGATSYEVWFVDPGKVVSTSTNVADEREYYSFHSDPLWSGTVQWRVRAVRTLYGSLGIVPVFLFWRRRQA